MVTGGVVRWLWQRRAFSIRCSSQAPQLPLEGLKILDLTRVLAGPYCTVSVLSRGLKVEVTSNYWVIWAQKCSKLSTLYGVMIQGTGDLRLLRHCLVKLFPRDILEKLPTFSRWVVSVKDSN